MEEIDNIKLGVYKHYKGGLYKVIGTAFHTEDEETLIIYQKIVQQGQVKFIVDPFFARPAKNFFEVVDTGGKKVKRFEFFGDSFK